MRLFRTIQAPLVALCVAFVGLVATSAAASADESGTQPLERAHAHNDYEHARPLLDALSHGFTSVEADVWWNISVVVAFAVAGLALGAATLRRRTA